MDFRTNLSGSIVSSAIWKLDQLGIIKKLREPQTLENVLSPFLHIHQRKIVTTLIETALSSGLIKKDFQNELRLDVEFSSNLEQYLAELKYVFEGYNSQFFSDQYFKNFFKTGLLNNERNNTAIAEASAAKNTPTLQKVIFKKLQGEYIEHFVDIGCGNGDVLFNLAPHFPKVDFLGIDISDVCIQNCKTKLSQLGLSNLKFATQDALELKLEPNQLIVSSFCFHEMLEQRNADILKFFDSFSNTKNCHFLLWEFCKPSLEETAMWNLETLNSKAPTFLAQNMWHALSGQPTPDIQFWLKLFAKAQIQVVKVYPFGKIGDHITYPLFHLQSLGQS